MASSLHQQIAQTVSGAAPSRVITLCDRALAHNPQDLYALRCKTVALLNSGKPKLAVAPAQQTVSLLKDEADESRARFMLALAHYKAGDYCEAKQHLFGVSIQSASVQNLLAQCHYNLEEFHEASRIYSSLLEAGMYRDEQERAEVLTNLSAALAQLDDVSQVETYLKQVKAPLPDFLFNVATAHLHSGRFDDAGALLDRAETLCKEEHGVSTASLPVLLQPTECHRGFIQDITPIIVQRAFCLIRNGKESEAQEMLDAIVNLKQDVTVATHATACVNLVALKRHSDFFDTMKKLRHVRQPQVEAKLTSRQRLFVKYNECLLLLGMGGKLSQCKLLVEQMCRDDPKSSLGPLALAAVLQKENKTQQAEEQLRKVLEEGAGSVAAQLTIAQLLLSRNDVSEAIRLLQSNQKLMENPAICCTVANAMAGTLKDMEGARSVLDGFRPKSSEFLGFAASFYSKYRYHREAAAAYHALMQDFPSAASVPLWRAGAVFNLAQVDSREAIEAGDLDRTAAASPQTLTGEKLPRGQLEQIGFQRAVSHGVDNLSKPARKRPLRRLPSESRDTVDLERWIPMKERSYVRDMPPRRRRELARRRADEQAEKRKLALRRKNTPKSTEE